MRNYFFLLDLIVVYVSKPFFFSFNFQNFKSEVGMVAMSGE